MSVSPSCPILVVHDDDAFRRKLIAALDQRHFTVTFAADGAAALQAMQQCAFRVIVIGIDAASHNGMESAGYVREHRGVLRANVIVVGDPHPQLREVARFADETLLKPVDPEYVADRARVYCR